MEAGIGVGAGMGVGAPGTPGIACAGAGAGAGAGTDVGADTPAYAAVLMRTPHPLHWASPIASGVPHFGQLKDKVAILNLLSLSLT